MISAAPIFDLLVRLVRSRLFMASTLFAVIMAVAVLWATSPEAYAEESAACDASTGNNAEKVDCWIQIVLSELREGGIHEAYEAFSHIYDTYPVFGASGCHQHAHKIGDTAYYELFVKNGLSLQDMEFPQETTSCGYGFYHGFIEHLIQDRPDPGFVVETCEYLRGRLSGSMRDVGTVCYHASGHGFTVAKADVLKEEEWGKLSAIIEEPLRQCESLPTTDPEIEDCRQGVFNVITDWMTMNNLGLTYDYAKPFTPCNNVPTKWQHACYYETGMKLEPVIGDSPLKAAEYVGSIASTTLRHVTFGVMVAGMMQRQAPLNGYETIIIECENIIDYELFHLCVRSAVNGMMEHGSPGKEYEKILPLCTREVLRERLASEYCFEVLANRLSRFYSSEKKQEICSLFPDEYRGKCAETR